MSVLNKPRIEAYIGASGSGKGVSINRRLAELKPTRMLVWDPQNDYPKHAKAVATLPGLVDAFKRAGAGPIRVRYVAGDTIDPHKAFAIVCSLAYTAGSLLFVAEELSDVTTPSWAPPAWRKCITQGRHRKLHVIGCAQRPALVDKTFLANATYIRCFTLRDRNDRRTMARALDVPDETVNALQTIEGTSSTEINYYEREFRTSLSQLGVIRLKHRASAEAAAT